MEPCLPTMIPTADGDERSRVEALRRYAILDTPVEKDFDDLCRLAAHLCGTPIAVINFIDVGRQWFKSEVGLGVRELPLQDSLCRHAILEEDTLVIPDTLEDDRFRGNPLCTDGPKLRFYAGAVIRTPENIALGTVCVLGHEPRQVTAAQVEALRTLARQAMSMLELRLQRREAQAAEERLRVSEERYRLAIRGAGLGTFHWELPARQMSWDEPMRTLYFLPPDAEITPERLFARVHPDDREQVRRALEEGLAGRGTYEVDYRVVSPDEPGRLRWVHAVGRAFHEDGGGTGQITRFDGIVADITARKVAQAEAAAAAERTRTVLESITSAFFSLDRDWRFTYVNAPMERLTTRRREDLLGRRVWDEFPAAAQGAFRPEYERAVRTGEPAIFEEHYPPLDLWLEVHAYPSPEGLSVFFHDVTKRVQAEQATREARDAAEAANRAKDEFLATLSHELRTPLNAILGWTQILRTDGPADVETWTEGLDVVERNTRAQVQLIEDLLDVSRITSGKLRLDVRPVSPADVLRAALDAVRPTADSRGVRLESVLDPHAGPISGDPDRLQQVVWNLLSNAIKFTPRGGKVQVSLARVNSSVEITVADSGQGIAPEFLPHVFERFQQADSSSTRSHKGLGLGLAIVRHLVELHGGTVRAESAGPGRGSNFGVSLPLAIAHAPAADPHPPGSGNGTATPREHPTAEDTGRRGSLHQLPRTLAGIAIVAVDDDPEARVLLQRILTFCGADVTVTATAEEALRAVERTRPDVLLSDVEMAGEDGYSLIARVRALGPDRGGDTPAAALTAYARAEDRTRALLAGFQLHVPKPVEPMELVAVVTNLAARARRAAPAV